MRRRDNLTRAQWVLNSWTDPDSAICRHSELIMALVSSSGTSFQDFQAGGKVVKGAGGRWRVSFAVKLPSRQHVNRSPCTRQGLPHDDKWFASAIIAMAVQSRGTISMVHGLEGGDLSSTAFCFEFSVP